MIKNSKASEASLIRPRKEKLITLPELTADGDEITIKIKQAYISDAWINMGGMAAMVEPPLKGQKKIGAAQTKTVLRRIAEIGVVEPKFSFNQREDGVAFWDDLSIGNQMFTVNEILDFTGISAVGEAKGGEEGAAERLATFLSRDAAGEGDSGGAVAVVHGGGGRAARRRGVRETAKRKGARV